MPYKTAAYASKPHDQKQMPFLPFHSTTSLTVFFLNKTLFQLILQEKDGGKEQDTNN